LPSGPHGLARSQIVEIQRARMLSAMFEVALERGAGSVTVAHVVERSGVSRRTYYEIFADREECFQAAFDDALERIARVVIPAFAGEGRWRERVRAALVELLGFLDEQPGVGRLVVVESLAAGARALERREEVLARLIAAVDEGRTEARGGSEPPPLTAEGVVGGVYSILYARLLESEPDSLLQLVGPLMSMIVLPYLGKVAAGKELGRPAPRPRTVSHDDGAYPFRDLGMRLTYRTLRVLDAVASNPNGSNRVLGEAAGIADQGQISKLLWRLQRLRLIDNVVGVPGRGAPNAWRLTEKGQSVHKAIETPRGSTGL
jgi:AcrR family transcriptional regulator